MRQSSLSRASRAGLFAVVLIAGMHSAAPARADKIQNDIAVFAALDKVTGRISHLEIPINQTVQFGALKVTPRVCDTRPPTEPPHTASFVEVDEIKLTGEVERIFTGWMFAESPGLHAVEHPVFDVWLTSCKSSKPVTPPGNDQNAAAPGGETPAAPGEAPAAPPAAEAPAAAPPPPAAPKPAPAAKPKPKPKPAPSATPPAPPPPPPPPSRPSIFPPFFGR
jgi:hypothetical protein